MNLPRFNDARLRQFTVPWRPLSLESCLLALIALCLVACNRREAAPDPRPPYSHYHEPPHGGTVVVLGDEEYHLEVLAQPAEGRLQIYVLDGHMDNFIRLPLPSFDLVLRATNQEHRLTLNAARRRATGEEVGDTALFEGQTDWLRGRTNFQAVLPQLTIRGREYRDVQFPFPEGNAPAHAH
jgi:hypothetical protein